MAQDSGSTNGSAAAQRAGITLDAETDLNITRQLGADPARLWTCWTTPLHLRAFFIPAPHAVTACEIDLRPGGRFNTTFDVEGREIRNHGFFSRWKRSGSWSSPMPTAKAGSPRRIRS